MAPHIRASADPELSPRTDPGRDPERDPEPSPATPSERLPSGDRLLILFETLSKAWSRSALSSLQILAAASGWSPRLASSRSAASGSVTNVGETRCESVGSASMRFLTRTRTRRRSEELAEVAEVADVAEVV